MPVLVPSSFAGSGVTWDLSSGLEVLSDGLWGGTWGISASTLLSSATATVSTTSITHGGGTLRIAGGPNRVVNSEGEYFTTWDTLYYTLTGGAPYSSTSDPGSLPFIEIYVPPGTNTFKAYGTVSETTGKLASTTVFTLLEFSFTYVPASSSGKKSASISC